VVQEAISANSKYWDGRELSFTDNTLKTIRKKAYLLDAEMLSSELGLTGEAAISHINSEGVTYEMLVNYPDSYSNMAERAILALKQNASRESRVEAIYMLQKLGFTNIYEENTRNYIVPPKDGETTAPVPEPTQKEQEQPQRKAKLPPRDERPEEFATQKYAAPKKPELYSEQANVELPSESIEISEPTADAVRPYKFSGVQKPNPFGWSKMQGSIGRFGIRPYNSSGYQTQAIQAQSSLRPRVPISLQAKTKPTLPLQKQGGLALNIGKFRVGNRGDKK
jgi:hypothetical protein